LIRRFRDDEANPDQMIELHSIDLPAADPGQMQPETALDELETEVLTVGHDVMRHLLNSEWEEVDRLLYARSVRRHIHIPGLRAQVSAGILAVSSSAPDMTASS
jgi:hypothetical protein